MAEQRKPSMLVQAIILTAVFMIITKCDGHKDHHNAAVDHDVNQTPAASAEADPAPTVTPLTPADAPVYIATLDRAIVGATKQLEEGNSSEALAEARPMLQLQGIANQLWPDVVFDPKATPEETALANMLSQNPLLRCRVAATHAGTWWLYAHDATDPRDAGMAAREMQGYLEDRTACLKGAPHFAAWLKKVKAEKASQYTVKTGSSKPPHPGCLEVVDIEAPNGAPHEWTCPK